MSDLATLMAAMEATAAAADKPIPVEMPGWGTVYVRGLTAADMDAHLVDQNGTRKHMFAAGVCRLMCDEAGKRTWNPADEAQVALMARQPWKLLQKLSDAVEAEPPKNA